MEPDTVDDAAAAWIREQLVAEGVDGGYVPFVTRHLRLPDATWRWCCGSSCDPCVQALGRVVDAARLRLGTAPPAD